MNIILMGTGEGGGGGNTPMDNLKTAITPPPLTHTHTSLN